MEKYSVLMSIYLREKPEYLKASAMSMLNQTVPPDEFVIVCDGPLTEELEAVVAQLVADYPDIMCIHRLPENVGIGAAANAGLQVCRNELIAKMDADDISVPNRCQMQLARFAQKPELAIIGGNIDEFSTDPDHPDTRRVVPAGYEELLRFARRRQPFNNMTVMYKKSAVLAVGGYRNFRRSEDYDLYARLLHGGYYAENLPEVVVKARVNADAQARRASLGTFRGCVHSRWSAYKMGFISLGDWAYCSLGALTLWLVPARLQRWIYSKFLRS